MKNTLPLSPFYWTEPLFVYICVHVGLTYSFPMCRCQPFSLEFTQVNVSQDTVWQIIIVLESLSGCCFQPSFTAHSANPPRADVGQSTRHAEPEQIPPNGEKCASLVLHRAKPHLATYTVLKCGYSPCRCRFRLPEWGHSVWRPLKNQQHSYVIVS